jgi:hypothetical protein
MKYTIICERRKDGFLKGIYFPPEKIYTGYKPVLGAMLRGQGKYRVTLARSPGSLLHSVASV